MRLTLDFYGDVQVDRTLAGIQDAVQDMRPVWDEITDQFVDHETRQFATEGRAGSGGWVPLSPRYAAWKAANYPGKGILERTGALKESLTQRPLPVEVLDEKSMLIGSDSEYGGYHQAGDGVPQRRPVELTEYRRREWVKLMQQHVMNGARR